MDYLQRYQQWLNDTAVDNETKEELLALQGNDEELKDRFYQELAFGTAGLRGKLGAGSNRMNSYIVARATHAFAKVISSYGKDFKQRGVAISHDCRIKSDEFAKIAACTFAAHNIPVYLYESLRSTPQLSFTVRHLHCAGGINITASHNPKDYNGYKVYWDEGSQIKDDIANQIVQEIQKITSFSEIPTYSFEQALQEKRIQWIGEPIDTIYLEKVKSLSLRDEEIDKNISIVYTPLNGAGSIPVQRVFRERGFHNVHVVKEQEQPDGTFPTIEYPNPEDLRAFEYSLTLAKKVNGELLIATDPDSDRLAVMCYHNGEYHALTGNQTGALLIEYLFSSMKEKNLLPSNGLMVKTIVTGEMGATIAKYYGVEVVNVLTGFKNISAISNLYEKTKEKQVLFGYEESIGYTAGTFVRDKDAVSSAMLLTEAAAYYKTKGMTLIDVLQQLFQTHGYFAEDTISLIREGIRGQEEIQAIMRSYRTDYPKTIGSLSLVTYLDYAISESVYIKTQTVSKIDIEPTNAIKFLFEDESWYALRPSGTEPKLKIYFGIKASSQEEADKKLSLFKNTVLSLIEK